MLYNTEILLFDFDNHFAQFAGLMSILRKKKLNDVLWTSRLLILQLYENELLIC